MCSAADEEEGERTRDSRHYTRRDQIGSYGTKHGNFIEITKQNMGKRRDISRLEKVIIVQIHDKKKARLQQLPWHTSTVSLQ